MKLLKLLKCDTYKEFAKLQYKVTFVAMRLCYGPKVQYDRRFSQPYYSIHIFQMWTSLPLEKGLDTPALQHYIIVGLDE